MSFHFLPRVNPRILKPLMGLVQRNLFSFLTLKLFHHSSLEAPSGWVVHLSTRPGSLREPPLRREPRTVRTPLKPGRSHRLRLPVPSDGESRVQGHRRGEAQPPRKPTRPALTPATLKSLDSEVTPGNHLKMPLLGPTLSSSNSEGPGWKPEAVS